MGARRFGPRAVLTGTSSDAHTWNLVYLQLVLEEHGFEVTNLGACVPDSLVVTTCADVDPELVVVSSVNGHGHYDGARMVRALRSHPTMRRTSIVIGGKLGIDGGSGQSRYEELRAAGFDEVFADDTADLVDFSELLRTIATQVPA